MQNRRARRNSGGIIIYIKDTIRQGIKLVKNDIDCIIWIVMDKNFFQLENDWYLAVAYIPPENSNYHTIYDVDIFNKLEEELCFYKSKGHKIALLGDLNSRIGRKCDFIENNSEINLEFEYTYGEMKTRNSIIIILEILACLNSLNF